MVAIFALYLFGFRFGFVIAEGRIDFEFRRIRTDEDAEDIDFYTAPEAQAEGWVFEPLVAPEIVEVEPLPHIGYRVAFWDNYAYELDRTDEEVLI